MSGFDKLSPWHPITDPKTLKVLGKLSEELGELQSAIARAIIQGIDECEPVTGKRNRIWITEEVADVKAGIELLVEHLDLSAREINIRSNRKRDRLREWHAGA